MQQDAQFVEFYRFIGAREGKAEGVVVYGAPLDMTTSFRPGTRMAPEAIRKHSWGLETYDLFLEQDLEQICFYDAGDVDLSPGSLVQALENIKHAAALIARSGGKPLMLGGEHLATFPVIEALYKQYPELAVIHLDAHADMRLEYMGQSLTHAGVMRKVSMLIGRQNVYSLGIRSASRDEIEYARSASQNFLPFDIKRLSDVVDSLSGRPVYLSLDIDVVDPAYAPGTGTPEPGGVSGGELLVSLAHLKRANLVGADVVEVCPPYDPSGITSLLAAKIVRQLVILMS